MISDKIQDAFNKQINAETYSAYMYWSMAACFEAMNLQGFAAWMKAQAQEEMTHAAKFFEFICERGGRVQLEAIDGPPTDWDSAQAIFEETYKHEQKVTALINSLVDLAAQEKDHAASAFLQWFVTEQVEEEANASGILEKLKLVGDAPGGLFMLDRELGARTFSPASGGGDED